jgi:hypothetical protein
MMRLTGVAPRVLLRRVPREVLEAEQRASARRFARRAAMRSCEELRWVVPRRRAGCADKEP